MNKTVMRFAILSLFSTAALAASVPHTFTAGDLARAADMNDNFTALTTAVTALEAKVAALEAKVGPHTMASLAGTYDVYEVAVDVDDISGTSKGIAGSVASGTVVLDANGTGQFNTTKEYRQVTVTREAVANVALSTDNVNVTSTRTIQSTTGQVNVTPDANTGSFTWSYSSGVVTIVANGNHDFAVAGQLLLGTITGEGQTGIQIFARR